jgi:hypothetical protein
VTPFSIITRPTSRDERRSSTSAMAPCLRRQVQILAALIRTQEAIPFGIGQHAAGDQVEFLRWRITTATAQQQLAVAHHRTESLAQRLQVNGLVDFQCFGNACLGQHLAALVQQRKNHFAAGDRTVVTLRLAFGMRVAHGARGGLLALGWSIGSSRRATGRRLAG